MLMEMHCPTFTHQLVLHEHVVERAFLSGMLDTSEELVQVALTLR